MWDGATFNLIVFTDPREDYYDLEYLMTLILLKTVSITIILQSLLKVLQPTIQDLDLVMLIRGLFTKSNSLQKTKLTCRYL